LTWNVFEAPKALEGEQSLLIEANGDGLAHFKIAVFCDAARLNIPE